LRGRRKDGRRGVSDVKMELLNEVTLANAVTNEYMKEAALTANDTPTVLINWVALKKKSMVPFFKIVIGEEVKLDSLCSLINPPSNNN
jgi:hypothetical protein